MFLRPLEGVTSDVGRRSKQSSSLPLRLRLFTPGSFGPSSYLWVPCSPVFVLSCFLFSLDVLRWDLRQVPGFFLKVEIFSPHSDSKPTETSVVFPETETGQDLGSDTPGRERKVEEFDF